MARVVAGDAQGAVVDDLDLAGGEVVGPRADIAGFVGGDIVEANFQEHAVLQAFHRTIDTGVGEANASATILARVIKRRVASN